MRNSVAVGTVLVLALFSIGFSAQRYPLAEYFTNTG